MTLLPQDIQDFLARYPDSPPDDPDLNANSKFYRNEERSQPDNLLVEEFHEEFLVDCRWATAYDKLEHHHGFIQWLFPIKEYGMNYHSQPLQDHELVEMKSDSRVINRLIASYSLMLNFYGIRLVSEETGLVDRALPPRNYESRYRNLVRSPHNNLRISRILKCLSEFGLERFNAGFLLHVLSEQSEHEQLNSRMIISSMDRWWANCLRDEDERKWIGKMIKRVRGERDFVFDRKMYQEALERRQRTGKLGE